MFKELYYWMYSYTKSVKTNNTPAFNAYLLICLLQGFNIGTIFIITRYFLRINTTTDRNTTIYVSITFGIILFIINYFLLYAQRKSIFEKYEVLPKEKIIKGKIYFWLYVILSVMLLFGLGANLVTPN